MAKVSQILEGRRGQWTELSALCERLETSPRSVTTAERTRFALLYRSACADLALADHHHLPPLTVRFLHQLVSRAHNQLYRSRQFDFTRWLHSLLKIVPAQIIRDPCVQISAILFWGLFFLSGFFAWNDTLWPGFAQRVLTEGSIDQLEESFSNPISEKRAAQNPFMASFYFKHNTTIGLQCFVGGVFIIPGLAIEAFNAIFLGTVFGHMLRPDVAARENFLTFVTAHGPFELTAIVISAGAGLRIGWGWVQANGWERRAAIQFAARRAMPVMGAAMVMFFLAGMIEAFVSGSTLPYWLKTLVACVSTILLAVYFFVLGREPHAMNHET